MRRPCDALSSLLLASRLSLLLPVTALLLMAGCAGAPPAQRTDSSVAAAPSPTRAQALQADAIGARVRWYGGIDRVQARDDGRDCFTLRYGHTDAQGRLQWPDDPRELHPFVACGPGRYERGLVEPFTVLRVEGRVVGQATVWGVPAPVLEIDAVHRLSDCLASETDFVAHPECRSGLLRPQ
ncbi:Uncharacterised protein [Xylophilus ampelinus]|nr:Uncharacterised protein [Xylophilus ampelinus]